MNFAIYPSVVSGQCLCLLSNLGAHRVESVLNPYCLMKQYKKRWDKFYVCSKLARKADIDYIKRS